MGHKEDLLAGAKKMLVERGFAHTTARDIVGASGTNLASIGYHFGSKDALMMQAMIELMGEWGNRFAPPEARAGDQPSSERFLTSWERLTRFFVEDRNLLIASYEIIGQIERAPELRAILVSAWELVRQDMAYDFLSIGEDVDGRTIRAVSSLLLALISGLSVQYLVDAESAPTAPDIALAMRFIGKALSG